MSTTLSWIFNFWRKIIIKTVTVVPSFPTPTVTIKAKEKINREIEHWKISSYKNLIPLNWNSLFFSSFFLWMTSRLHDMCYVMCCALRTKFICVTHHHWSLIIDEIYTCDVRSNWRSVISAIQSLLDTVQLMTRSMTHTHAHTTKFRWENR